MQSFQSKATSITELQEAAQAATADGLTQSDLRVLSRLGTSGKHRQNCERDFHRQLHRLNGFRFEPFMVTVPYKDSAGKLSETKVALVLPHEWFTVLFELHAGRALEMLTCTPSRLQE